MAVGDFVMPINFTEQMLAELAEARGYSVLRNLREGGKIEIDLLCFGPRGIIWIEAQGGDNLKKDAETVKGKFEKNEAAVLRHPLVSKLHGKEGWPLIKVCVYNSGKLQPLTPGIDCWDYRDVVESCRTMLKDRGKNTIPESWPILRAFQTLTNWDSPKGTAKDDIF